MSQTEGYNEEEKHITNLLFTDFDGKFKARLSAVVPNRNYTNYGNENAPISSKYDCRIKVTYHKNIMSLLEEGMIFAVKNFKSKNNSDGNTNSQQNEGTDIKRFTLLVASRIWPDHYGLRALSDHTYYPMQFEVIEQSVADWDTEDKSTMMVKYKS